MLIEISLSDFISVASRAAQSSSTYIYTAKKPVEYQHGKQKYTLSLDKGELFSITVLKDGTAQVVHDDEPTLKFKISAEELKDLLTKCKDINTTTVTKPVVNTNLKKYEQCYNPALYEQAKKSINGQMTYIKYVFNKANSVIFDNQLEMPNFRIAKTRHLGSWNVRRRMIHLSPVLFIDERKEYACLNTLIHEICHQAVSEINKIQGEVHGVNWKNWMIKAGLSTRASATSDIDSTPDEVKSTHEVKPFDVVSFEDGEGRSKRYITGVVIGVKKLKTKTQVTIVHDSIYSDNNLKANTYSLNPTTVFNKVPKERLEYFKTTKWNEAVKRAISEQNR